MHTQQSKLFHAFHLQCYGAHIRTLVFWKRKEEIVCLSLSIYIQYEVENLIESH